MSIYISNIIKNFNTLTNVKSYYEEEIFTKLEDAFLFELGKATSGIDIVHGYRSMATYSSVILGTDLTCEVGDLRLIMYQKSTGKLRQLFLQFKAPDDSIMLKNQIFRIPDKQYYMYVEHPVLTPGSKANFIHPTVLQDTVYHDKSMEHAGTMFVAAYKSSGQTELYFANADKVVKSSKYRKKDHFTWQLVSPLSSVLRTKTSGAKYDYYESLASLSELLNGMKKMQVGMEIDFKCLVSTISLKDMPEAVLLIGEKEISEYHSEEVKSCFPTMFIDVEELV